MILIKKYGNIYNIKALKKRSKFKLSIQRRKQMLRAFMEKWTEGSFGADILKSSRYIRIVCVKNIRDDIYTLYSWIFKYKVMNI